jgi:long-chain acyl-CoA synthetase
VFVSLLNHPKIKGFGLDKVRTFNTGGAPCPLEVIEQWERTFGRTLNEGYGLSETSPVTHTTPQLATRKPGTIGIPICDTDIKVLISKPAITNLPTGSPELASRASGDEGLLAARRERPRVAKRGTDGRIWFHTGDVARIDEDGYTSIVQRKDLIIVAASTCTLLRSRRCCHMHPAVRRWPSSACDAYHGEIVRACVVLKEGMSAWKPT